MKYIDALTNRITMYKLVFYELLALIAAAIVFSFIGLVPYNGFYIAASALLIFILCVIFNKAFATVFNSPSNPESVWITALILALIIAPPSAIYDTHYLALAFWASAWAVASKYIIARRRKHIFNPAAFGVAMPAIFLGLSASWWIGTPAMAPLVLIGGILVVRKIHRFDLVLSFLAVFAIGVSISAGFHGVAWGQTLYRSFLSAPVLFFASVMLTEPATTPPKRGTRILYGIIVGLLFLPDAHIASFYVTPELALIIGNIFSYFVGFRRRLELRLSSKTRLSRDVFEFSFAADGAFRHQAGQYMEWTLPHAKRDLRGVRRYFTLASSPTEGEVRLGVKFSNPSSTFKKALLSLQAGESISAGELSGDFVLPKDKERKLVFMAGGIGVTPFRSMVRYLLDKGESRDVVLLYSVKNMDGAVYADLFERARNEIGMRSAYVFTEEENLPDGALTRIDEETIVREVPDFGERLFYISGPQSFVNAMKGILKKIGVRRKNVKTDYFPGLA